ncbi:MAG: metallopeptidase TldD-related protein [Sulfolobaceae archaeon]
MYSDIYYYSELNIVGRNDINGFGTYEHKKEFKVNRYLINNKWIISSNNINLSREDLSEPRKPYEKCEGKYIHESVNYWKNISEEINKIISNNIDLNLLIISKYIKRNIISNEFECHEEKIINYIELCRYKFSYLGNIAELKDIINFLREKCREIITLSTKRVWEIQGRVEAVIDPEIFATVLHYFIRDFLNGNLPKFQLNQKILGDISVYDNPLNTYCAGLHYFDDEGVKTKRKEILGDGYVIDYLGTRTSKYGEPGNARGIIPEPDYFCMEIKGGDWRLEELFEENKQGIFVSGVLRSEKVDNSVRIIPRYVRKGDKEYLKVREIAIPFTELLSINGISREIMNVSVDEFHFSIAPFIKMPIRIILF